MFNVGTVGVLKTNFPFDLLLHNFDISPNYSFVEVGSVVLRAVRDPSVTCSHIQVQEWVLESAKLNLGKQQKTTLNVLWRSASGGGSGGKSKTKHKIMVSLLLQNKEAVKEIVTRCLKRSLLLPLTQISSGLVFGVAVAGIVHPVQVNRVEECPNLVRDVFSITDPKQDRYEDVQYGLCLMKCFGERLFLGRLKSMQSRSKEEVGASLLVISNPGMMAIEIVMLVAKKLTMRFRIIHDVPDGDNSNDTELYILEGIENMSKEDCKRISHWIDQEHRSSHIVVIVSLSFSISHKSLFSLSRFGVPVVLNPPNRQERMLLMESFLGDDSSSMEPMELQEMTDVTGGFSITDLQRLCKSALRGVESDVTLINRLRSARQLVVPSQMQKLCRTEPVHVLWENVYGCDHVQRALEASIIWPLKNADRLSLMDCSSMGGAGILLYGPTGCGKSICVHAFAATCQINLVQVEAVHLLSKYTGETEENIRKTFAQARELAPCVLFFDDIDEMAPARSVSYNSGEDTGGASERIVSTFLNEMDGIDSRVGVFVVSCSSKPWMIDPALTRKGRIDKMIYVGLPDEKARKMLCTYNLRSNVQQHCDKIVHATEGLTCASISGILKEIEKKNLEEIDMDQILAKAMIGKVPNDILKRYQTY